MDDEKLTRADYARSRVADVTAEFERRRLSKPTEPDEPNEEAEGGRPRFNLALGPQHVRVLGALIGAAVVAALWFTRSPEAATDVEQPVKVEVSEDQAQPEELVIDVAGKVASPGIVVLPAGSRVMDALDAAGGPEGDVDLSSVNLARPLVDGEQILIGIEPAIPQGSSGSATPGLISLNSATIEQLQTLPGVGPVTAQAIVTWRESNGGFRSVDDLLDVKGIGEATLAELRQHVTP